MEKSTLTTSNVTGIGFCVIEASALRKGLQFSFCFSLSWELFKCSFASIDLELHFNRFNCNRKPRSFEKGDFVWERLKSLKNVIKTQIFIEQCKAAAWKENMQ